MNSSPVSKEERSLSSDNSKNSASSSRRIVVHQTSDKLPGGLFDELSSEGFEIASAPKFGDIQKLCDPNNPPVLLVEGGLGEHSLVILVKSLVDAAPLHSFRLLLLGSDAVNYETLLSNSFPIIRALNLPVELDELTQNIRELSIESSRIDLSSDDASSNINTEIPGSLFDNLRDLIPNGKTLGGRDYLLRASDLADIEPNYLPGDDEERRLTEAVCTRLGKVSSDHLHRVAFVNYRILDAIGVQEEMRDAGKLASFLFAGSFERDERELLRREYFRLPNAAYRKKLADRISDSATRAASDLALPMVGNIVSAMGGIIGARSEHGEGELGVIASALVAADALGRSCWNTRLWNSRGAYWFMNRVTKGEIKGIHHTVLCCLVALLAEAVASRRSSALLKEQIRQDPALIEASRRVQFQAVSNMERKVGLAELQPGMRLTQPITAFDGRLILAANMRLDEDIIWRLWRLSAIRPLNDPLVVAVRH